MRDCNRNSYNMVSDIIGYDSCTLQEDPGRERIVCI